jgi:DNA-binding NarL/FixJ family response regulator
MKRKIKIAIVDDDPIYRQILSTYFKRFEDLKIVVNCSNGKELIENLLKQKPHVALLDVEMPVMDGRETTKYLNKNHPEIKILILTSYHDYELSNDLIKKGAHGFFIKGKGLEWVIDAIQTISKQDYYLKDWDLQKIITTTNGRKEVVFFSDIKFSDKEIKVIRLLCAEKTSKEISEKLFMSKRTIDGYRTRIYKKTNVGNVAGLVTYAMQHGLISNGSI